MLTPKLGSPTLLAASWLAKAPARVASSRPIAQTRTNLIETHSSTAKRFIVQRNYFQVTSVKTRRSSKARTPRTMLAVATVAAVGSAGAAGYATSTNTANSNTPVTENAPFISKLESAAFQIPHPEKQHKGGEDTYLVSSNGLVIGVFDGTSFFFLAM